MKIFNYRVRHLKIISQCGIEVFRGDRSSLVIVTELPNNPGRSICNAFEDLFPQVCQHYKLDPTSVLWIERWEAWKTSDDAPYDHEEEDYSKVEFDWNGRKAINLRWLYVTSSFVEAAKSILN